mgnify:FL=1
MQDLVVLVWFTMNIYNPELIKGPEMSERTFADHNECRIFVNRIAQSDVVNEKYEFGFGTPDGTLFRGGCYNGEEYNRIFNKEES